jgi:hypothetical protein
MLAAVLAGHDESTETVTAHVIQPMQRLGIKWMKEGKPVTDPRERYMVVSADAAVFLSEKLPDWQRLGILEPYSWCG